MIVDVQTTGHVTTLRMNDPGRRNVLGPEMLTELIAAFDRLTSETRAIILRAGPKDLVWCSGFDIKSLKPEFDPLAVDGQLQRLFARISASPAAVIGMIHGSAWGGGTDLAFRCDILIGDRSAQFAFTPARLGLPYDGGGLLNVLLRVGPGVAAEMFATAQPIGAERALRVGILNHLVEAEDLEHFTTNLAHAIVDNAPLTVASAKQHLRAFTTALTVPEDTAEELRQSRTRALSSEDYAEGIAAFEAKRKPSFTGR